MKGINLSEVVRSVQQDPEFAQYVSSPWVAEEPLYEPAVMPPAEAVAVPREAVELPPEDVHDAVTEQIPVFHEDAPSAEPAVDRPHVSSTPGAPEADIHPEVTLGRRRFSRRGLGVLAVATLFAAETGSVGANMARHLKEDVSLLSLIPGVGNGVGWSDVGSQAKQSAEEVAQWHVDAPKALIAKFKGDNGSQGKGE